MPFAEIDKQLAKLAYITAPETVDYLAQIRKWKEELQHSFELMKCKLDDYTQELLRGDEQQFTATAAAKTYKSYIFKSRANKLTIEDLQKGLNTPNKVIELQRELQMR